MLTVKTIIFGILPSFLIFPLFVYQDFTLLDCDWFQRFKWMHQSHWSLSLKMIFNLMLYVLFVAMHLLFTSNAIRTKVTNYLPPQMYRSTYMTICGSMLLAIMFLWRPMNHTAWTWSVYNGHVTSMIYSVLYWGLMSVPIIVYKQFGFLETTGIRDLNLSVREMSNLPAEKLCWYSEKGLFKYVRHPAMSAAILAVFMNPELSYDALLYGTAMLVLAVIGMTIREKRMVEMFGDKYRKYQERVPMLFPMIWSPWTWTKKMESKKTD